MTCRNLNRPQRQIRVRLFTLTKRLLKLKGQTPAVLETVSKISKRRISLHCIKKKKDLLKEGGGFLFWAFNNSLFGGHTVIIIDGCGKNGLSRLLKRDPTAIALRFYRSVIRTVYVPHQAIRQHMEGTETLTSEQITSLCLCGFCFIHLSPGKNEVCDYLYLRLANECVLVGEKADIVFIRNS